MGICRTNEKGPNWVSGDEKTDSKSEKSRINRTCVDDKQK